MMRAVLFDPQHLKQVHVGEIAKPTPGPDEVLIQVHAVSLNHRDLYVMGGWHAPDHPVPLASDASGIICGLGAHVHGWSVGDAVIFNPGFSCGECDACLKGELSNCEEWTVFGGPGPGVLTEYITVPAKYLIHKPEYLSFEEAAAIPLALGTAWRSMVVKGGLQQDDVVLLQGVGGGVSQLAMQVANATGIKTIVTSGSDGKLERARQMGAWQGINYKTEDVAARIREVTEGRGVTLSIDSGGHETLPISTEVLRKSGRIVLVGFVTGGKELDTKQLFDRILEAEGSLIVGQMASQNELQAAVDFYAQHQLRPGITTGYTLDTAAQAFEDLAAFKQFGKVVIKVVE